MASKNGARYSHFLTKEEQTGAIAAAKAAQVDVAFYGGFTDASRCVAVFSGGKDMDKCDMVCGFSISYDAKHHVLTHRDFLGALMALGIKRERIGDIRVSGGYAVVFVENSVSAYIRDSLVSVGRAKISIQSADMENLPKEDEGKEITIVVATPRLDAVLAEGFIITRKAAAQLCEKNLVMINHKSVSKADKHVYAGDIISLRGYGRLDIGNSTTTKKNRQRMIVYKHH